MPGFFTDYANNKLLDQVFGGTAFPPPATLYIGLSKTPASKRGQVSEPSGGGYARVPVPNTPASFPAASEGTKANRADVTFPAPKAAWGTVVSLFLADAAAGGNVIASADLVTPRTLNAGDRAPAVAAGAFYVSHT